MDKNQLANLLNEVATLMELKAGSNPFEVRAYQNAARSIPRSTATSNNWPAKANSKGYQG